MHAYPIGATLARMGDSEGMTAAYKEAVEFKVWPSQWQRPQYYALEYVHVQCPNNVAYFCFFFFLYLCLFFLFSFSLFVLLLG